MEDGYEIGSLDEAIAELERRDVKIRSLESRIMELEMQMAKRAYKLEEAYNEIKRMTNDPHN